jgi:hypothetical protein
MSSTTIEITDKELKEAYNFLPKERLIEIIIEKTKEIRELREKI